MKKTINNFDKSLILSTPASALTAGFMVRNRGLSHLSAGSFKARDGSALLHALNAHTITYFNDIYHYGVGTALYRAAVEIVTGLSGSRLAFAAMGPTAGVVDYLFCAGGGDLFKVDSAGNDMDWGFAIPASDPSAAAAAGGALADATWGYQITYYNSTTGHRSNANGTTVEATTAGANNSVALTSIPDPSAIDTQISHVEIWRTEADGTLLFFLARIAAGTTTYTDDGSVTLSSTQLPTDNTQPYAYFTDCLGPFNGAMFWITNSESGQRGRLFYSPIGRAESLKGFIEVSHDDAPLQRLFRFQGQLGVIGESGIFLIGGADPYTSREVPNCPGTTKPWTVVESPFGIFYEASDGVRLFNGNTSELVMPNSVESLFQGNDAYDLTSFSGVVACFARNSEYFISDGSQSLAYDVTAKRWRDLGVGFNALFYNEETAVTAGTISSEVLSFEDPAETDDNGTGIALSLQPRQITFDDDIERILQHLTLDINTGGNSISLYVQHGTTETLVGSFSTSVRTKQTFNPGLAGNVFGFRLSGTLTAAGFELYAPATFIFNDIE